MRHVEDLDVFLQQGTVRPAQRRYVPIEPRVDLSRSRSLVGFMDLTLHNPSNKL